MKQKFFKSKFGSQSSCLLCIYFSYVEPPIIITNSQSELNMYVALFSPQLY